MMMTQVTETERKRVLEIIRYLKKEYTQEYTHMTIALNYNNPLELLVAIILSAQCTDERVNRVTDMLFKKYRTAQNYAEADLIELEEHIRSTGFYHVNARNIKNASIMLVVKFTSEVPRNMKSFQLLPGVWRKTANMVFSNAYDVVEGITVDTHVRRLSQKLGLTVNKDPTKVIRASGQNILINVGRAIIYSDDPQKKAITYHNLFNEIRASL